MVLKIVMVSLKSIGGVEKVTSSDTAAVLCSPVELLYLFVQLSVQCVKVVVVLAPDLGISMFMDNYLRISTHATQSFTKI